MACSSVSPWSRVSVRQVSKLRPVRSPRAAACGGGRGLARAEQHGCGVLPVRVGWRGDRMVAAVGEDAGRHRLRGAVVGVGRLSVLAYAGLRPGEALALRWEDVGERTLQVERAVANGLLKATKTGQRRSVRLLSPVRSVLAVWRLASGRPPATALVFARPDGRPFTEVDWRNWRRRVFEPAAEAAGLSNARPYDLRQAYVSLLIREGASVVEVARQAGHSPTMALDTYGHVFAELEGAEKVSAAAEIRRARDELVPVSYLEELAPDEGPHETPAIREPSIGLEPMTPSLPWKCSTN